MRDESTQPDASPAALVMQALAREIRRKRAVDPHSFRGALILHIRSSAGRTHSFSLIVDEREVWLGFGAVQLPMVQSGQMHVSEQDLLALAKGACTAGELMREGRLCLEGNAQILRTFGSYFQGGETWVSVRLAR